MQPCLSSVFYSAGHPHRTHRHPAPPGSMPSPAGPRLTLMGLPWWKSLNTENNEISKDPKKGYHSSHGQTSNLPPAARQQTENRMGERRGGRGGRLQTVPGGREVKKCSVKKKKS